MKNSVLFILICIIFFIGCNRNDKGRNEAGNNKLNDGIYLVLNEYTDTSNIKNGQGKLIDFSHYFLEDNFKGQPLKLEIDTAEFVQIELEKMPDSLVQPDKRINLILSLTDSSGEHLSGFTEKHVGQKVAIVIGGKAVTEHKVRAKIEGGQLQITRCTDNACKYLFEELKKNVRK